MVKHSRRYKQNEQKVDKKRYYQPEEAIDLALELADANFDESIELHLKLGADPSQGDQTVRGTLILPHGTGNVPTVAVFAEGDAAEAAKEAGADRVGAEDLVEAIDEGWDEFDVLVAQPQMMRIVGPLGRKLGPRMPSKKAGNITEDVASAVEELKAGKVEYRMDRGACIHLAFGKASFTQEQLLENLLDLVATINAARPAAVAGRFIRSATISSSMGPGIKVDADELVARARAQAA